MSVLPGERSESTCGVIMEDGLNEYEMFPASWILIDITEHMSNPLYFGIDLGREDVTTYHADRSQRKIEKHVVGYRF
jgi:hypothetical protein